MAANDHLPSADDILRAFGARRAPRGTDALSTVALFGAGLLVGAGLALLLAPVSGEELREQINERTDDLRKKASEIGANLRAEAEGDGRSEV